MRSYFKVVEQFRSQDEPAYCGLTSLAIVLNALAIDPRRLWKGAWRWFTEQLLDCCKPVEQVKETGITLQELACLARCNGATVMVHGYHQGGEDEFREHVRQCSSQEGQYLIVSYDRKVVSQTGSGHFSPVAGYNAERDLVLVLDVAGYKYPHHWLPLSLLYQAMEPVDPDTGKPRGYLLLARGAALYSAMYSLTSAPGATLRVAKMVEAGAKVIEEAAQSPSSTVAALVDRLAAALVREGIHELLESRAQAKCCRHVLTDSHQNVAAQIRNTVAMELGNHPLFKVLVERPSIAALPLEDQQRVCLMTSVLIHSWDDSIDPEQHPLIPMATAVTSNEPAAGHAQPNARAAAQGGADAAAKAPHAAPEISPPQAAAQQALLSNESSGLSNFADHADGRSALEALRQLHPEGKFSNVGYEVEYLAKQMRAVLQLALEPQEGQEAEARAAEMIYMWHTCQHEKDEMERVQEAGQGIPTLAG